jgi:hypothetical protein
MNAGTHTSFILIERHAGKVAPSLRSPLKKLSGLRKNLSDGVEELAEKAWRSVNKEITIKGVTVKVRGVHALR